MKLIEKSSPTYLKRMAREINRPGRRVYHGELPVSEGKFSHGYLLIRFTNQTDWVHPTSVDAFFDGQGRNVCASREAR
jgi:hypothetical protein